MIDDNLSPSQIKVKQKFNQQLRFRFSENIIVEDVIMGIRFTKYVLNLEPKYLEELKTYKSEFAVLTEKCSNVEFCIDNGKICIYVQNDDFNEKQVSFYDLVNCEDFINYKTGLPFPVGKDFYGKDVIIDLRNLFDLICIGFVGSTMFDLFANMILSLSMKYSPSELKLMLIEPKNYNLKKFDIFEGLPNLLGSRVFKENDEILNVINDISGEINKRYDYLSEMGATNIESYNNCDAVKKGRLTKMPYVVVVINKFENVISINKTKIERIIQVLTSKGKACGFNLVIGTEKATDDVITNVVIRHIHSRLFFKTKQVSSKYVNLLPETDLLFTHGDMLLMPYGKSLPQRIQCAYINYNNIQDFVKEINDKYKK